MAQRREHGIYAFRNPRRKPVVLPWHFRNELDHYGYLDIRPCYENRDRFRISRWLNEDDIQFYKDVESARYSEQEDFYFGSLEPRLNPWERKSELIAEMPRFHTDKENKRYVNRTLDHIIDADLKYDSLQVVCTPYGGHPLVCIVRNDKITIF